MSEKHYDGDSPNEPLPPEHFTEQQRKEAEELGDGSPGLDRRLGQDEKEKNADAGHANA